MGLPHAQYRAHLEVLNVVFADEFLLFNHVELLLERLVSYAMGQVRGCRVCLKWAHVHV